MDLPKDEYIDKLNSVHEDLVNTEPQISGTDKFNYIKPKTNPRMHVCIFFLGAKYGLWNRQNLCSSRSMFAIPPQPLIV